MPRFQNQREKANRKRQSKPDVIRLSVVRRPERASAGTVMANATGIRNVRM